MRSPRSLFGIAFLLTLAPSGCGLRVHDGTAGDGATGSSTGTPTSAGTTDVVTSSTAAGTQSATEATTDASVTTGVTPPRPCDQWQEDCPPGSKCMPYDSNGSNVPNTLGCFPIARDAKQLGEACTSDGLVSGLDECDLHLLCWRLDDDGTGVCISQCLGTPASPSCPPGTDCHIDSSGILTVCHPFCDPLIQDCVFKKLCVPNSADGGETFVCVPDESGDGGQPFDPCTDASTCDGGNLCLDTARSTKCPPDAAGCCLPLCARSEGDAPCQALDPAMRCLPWYDAGRTDPEKQEIGACGVPPA